MIHHKQQSGFALLMALIVVGVVVAVGLTILDLTVKQLNLSTNSKESESSFHAANAGLECAQYWRLKESNDLEDGSTVDFECFGESAITVSDTFSGSSASVGPGSAYLYDFQFDWGSIAEPRCSKIKMLIMSDGPSNISGTTVSNIDTIFPTGFSAGASKTCPVGGRCSVISVQGYNKGCGNIGSVGTLERQVLLES